MSQETQTPDWPGRDELIRMPSLLSYMLHMGRVETETFILGLQLIARMTEHRRVRITMSLDEAGDSVVEINGKLFAGFLPQDHDSLYYTIALQQLHQLGFISEKTQRLADISSPETPHFTTAVDASALEWSKQTPLYFRFDPERMYEVVNAVRDGATNLRKSKTVISVVL